MEQTRLVGTSTDTLPALAPVAEERGPEHFLGRQPVFDPSLNLYGYELLLHSAAVDSPLTSIRHTIDDYLLLAPVASHAQTFVRCTRQLLLAGSITRLPHGSVLEIHPEVMADPMLIERCRALRLKGYHFALEGASAATSQGAFLSLAEFLKVDFRGANLDERQPVYALAKSSGTKLLACNVHSEQDFTLARKEGCSLFHGFFFARPVACTQRVTSSNHLIYMRILAALSRPSPEVQEIEKMVLGDAVMCLRILQLVNSAMYGLRSRISSIRNAIMLLGCDEVRKLVTIALAGGATNRQHKVLAHMALERARFCELIAPLVRLDPAELYLTGMLSLIDVIVKMPMADVLETLPVSQDMKDALSGGNNPIAEVLEFVRRYELCDWETCELLRRSLGLSEPQAVSFYLDSVRWTAAVMPG